MSEEILSALMELFGLIAKQDEGVGAPEKEYVENFLKSQIEAKEVEAYFATFMEKAASSAKVDANGNVIVDVRDSVKILGICRKINKKLNREQKVVVLVRLYEMLSASHKFTEKRMEVINTVADVFKLEKDEIKSIETFNVQDDASQMDIKGILIANEQADVHYENALHIQTGKLDGSIFVLRVQSANMFFIRYLGDQIIYVNNQTLAPGQIYPLSKASFIRMPQGAPLYYTDIVAKFMNESNLQKISFEVKNVGFKFKTGGIGLRNINMAEEQGKLIGIMGASGAGKTTLLNVLCGNEAPSEGEVLINGLNLHTQSEQLEGVIGLIPQDDLLIEELTVYQNLYYNAKLCFRDKNEKQIDEMVCNTLKSLGLYERKDLRVGSPLNKMISGGQRKRLNIALELIREPGILFVDEPTSGLSSRDSENVMNLLRELALKGKLVFVVIHQPSSDIYKMFDKMFILDTGGYPVYYGNPTQSISYFKELNNQIDAESGECPTCGNLNPELIFNILDASVIDEYGNYTNQRKVKPEEWYQKYTERIEIPKVTTVKDQPPRSLNIPNWFKQFWIYTTRDFWAKISNTQYILLNILEAPLLGFVLAYLIRYIADPNSDIYIFNENENIPIYIFMAIVVAIFFGLIVSAEEIFKDAKILKREAFLNLSRSAYLMSKILILMGLSAIQMILFLLVANFIIGFKGMNFEFWLMLFSVAVSSNILGLIISSTFNSIVTIYIMIPLLMIPQMVLGGAMFTFDKLNKTLTSVDKVPLVAEFIPARYAYEGLIVYQYKHNKFNSKTFDVQMEKSQADYKISSYLPKVKEVLDKSLSRFESGVDTTDQSYIDDLELVHNELANEMRRNPEIEFNKLSLLTPSKFSTAAFYAADEYIDQLKSLYNERFGIANNKLDQMTEYMLNKDVKLYNQLKNDYENETIRDIVLKTLDKHKILRDGNRLIQIMDPVYNMPEPEGLLSFRTHFFAPYKYFLGKFWDTLWFNIFSVWFLTIVLYIVLYYDWVRKGFEWLSELDLKKKLNKIKGKK
ncbi:MAG: ATP-binding cassette domain-containing protein [Bacteroidales bacterium]|nr:ATP-binding cassette domain-containing protein [Bacteroidales bacterium]